MFLSQRHRSTEPLISSKSDWSTICSCQDLRRANSSTLMHAYTGALLGGNSFTTIPRPSRAVLWLQMAGSLSSFKFLPINLLKLNRNGKKVWCNTFIASTFHIRIVLSDLIDSVTASTVLTDNCIDGVQLPMPLGNRLGASRSLFPTMPLVMPFW